MSQQWEDKDLWIKVVLPEGQTEVTEEIWKHAIHGMVPHIASLGKRVISSGVTYEVMPGTIVDASGTVVYQSDDPDIVTFKLKMRVFND